jgi:hypothetical protein
MTHAIGPGAAVLFGLMLAAPPARAAGPVALVEEVAGTPAGVEVMNYLVAGSVIRLGATDRVVVDYLGSCVRETITGGVVTVGAGASDVVGGNVKRETVQCDGGRLKLSTEQAAQSGAMVFRGAPPKRVLYGLSPLIDLAGGSKLVVERLDRPGERLEIDLAGVQLVRGTFYDFAKEGLSLTAGGTYRARVGGRSVTFKIDPSAQPGQTPLAGRLLRL